MPALPDVPDVLRIVNHLQVSEDVSAINRFFFRFSSGSPTNAQLDTMAASVQTAWATNIAPLCSSATVQLLSTDIEDLTTTSSAVGTATSTHVGTRAGTPLDATTAVVIKHVISRRYRGGHPRTYLPGGVTADLAGEQNWTAGFIAAVIAGWDAYRAAIITAIAVFGGVGAEVNVSYYKGFTVIIDPITGRARNHNTTRAVPGIDLVSSTAVNPRPGTQRRRSLQGT